MALLAVKVLEPGGSISAQLVDEHMRVDALLPPLIRQMELPERLTYELVDHRRDKVLRPRETLSGVGVKDGSVLLLRVVRNGMLELVLRELYGEARGWARDKIWDLVRDRLATIHRLEPRYPDPDRLAAALSASAPSAPASFFDPSSGPPAAPPPPAAPSAPAKPAAKGGCLGPLVLVVVVVLVARNWTEVKGWFDQGKGRPKSEGQITAGGDGRIEVVDHNSVSDFAYQLYLNDRYVGDVRNRKGESSSFPVRFDPGMNAIELRYLEDQGARDTNLVIRVNGGEFERQFADPGQVPRLSFRWDLDAVRR